MVWMQKMMQRNEGSRTLAKMSKKSLVSVGPHCLFFELNKQRPLTLSRRSVHFTSEAFHFSCTSEFTMGCWNETCLVTFLPITFGTPDSNTCRTRHTRRTRRTRHTRRTRRTHMHLFLGSVVRVFLVRSLGGTCNPVALPICGLLS